MKSTLFILGGGLTLASAAWPPEMDLPRAWPRGQWNYEHLPSRDDPPSAPGWPKGNWDPEHDHPLWNIGTCVTHKPGHKKHTSKHGYCIAYDHGQLIEREYKCGMCPYGGECKKDGDPCYVNAFKIKKYANFCLEEGGANGRSKDESGTDGYPERRSVEEVDGDSYETEDEDDFDHHNSTLLLKRRVTMKRARCSMKLKEDPVPPKCEGVKH